MLPTARSMAVIWGEDARTDPQALYGQNLVSLSRIDSLSP